MFRNLLKYLWHHRPTALQVLAVMLTLIIAVIVYYSYGKPFVTQWNDWINTLITIATLFIAVFVWINETVVKWENSLQKKLDIVYLYNNEVFATVLNAPLAGENDIRNWGLSIGQTILNQRVSINFSGFKIEGPKRNDRKNIIQYSLTVYLFETIETISKGAVFSFDDNGNLSEDNRKLIKHKQNSNNPTGNLK
ncbi:MAG: hypothetical protein ABI675_04240 [Chitinophagaceae bacterium]